MAAHMAARACERSATLTRALRNARFRGRDRIVAEIQRLPLPGEVTAECSGVRYRLDLTDDVQRQVYLECYEEEDLSLAQGLVRPGSVAVDVGANIGFYALHLAKQVGTSGVVHAFEPDPRIVERLRGNCDLNEFGRTVRVHEAAVSDRSGRATLYRSDPSHSGWGSLAEFPDVARSEVEVRTVTLDEFVEEEGIDVVDLLKVDVEAGEMELLRGARRSLVRRRFRHVLIEFNGPRLAQRGTSLSQFVAAFADAGYRPSGVRARILSRLESDRIAAQSRFVNLLFQPA